MLQRFLQKMDKTYRISNIIFVDDTQQNVTDVADAYQHSNVSVISAHYAGMDAHKAALTSGPEAKKLQATANREWVAIRESLHRNLPGFVLGV